MIVFMQWYMRSRPRYEVRTLLVVWNVALATFSIIGAARTLPEFVLSLQHGIYYSVCDPRFVRGGRIFRVSYGVIHLVVDWAWVGLTSLWMFHRLPNSVYGVWANGNVAESARKMGKKVKHLNRSQPNPGPRPVTSTCS